VSATRVRTSGVSGFSPSNTHSEIDPVRVFTYEGVPSIVNHKHPAFSIGGNTSSSNVYRWSAVLIKRPGNMIEMGVTTAQEIPELARVHVIADWDAYAPFPERMRIGSTQLSPSCGGARRDATEACCALRSLTARSWVRALLRRPRRCLAQYHRQRIGNTMLRRLPRALYERGIFGARFDVVVNNPQAVAFYTPQGARPIDRCVKCDPRGTQMISFALLQPRPPKRPLPDALEVTGTASHVTLRASTKVKMFA
jgi:hypothetical protein